MFLGSKSRYLLHCFHDIIGSPCIKRALTVEGVAALGVTVAALRRDAKAARKVERCAFENELGVWAVDLANETVFCFVLLSAWFFLTCQVRVSRFSQRCNPPYLLACVLA